MKSILPSLSGWPLLTVMLAVIAVAELPIATAQAPARNFAPPATGPSSNPGTPGPQSSAGGNNSRPPQGAVGRAPAGRSAYASGMQGPGVRSAGLPTGAGTGPAASGRNAAPPAGQAQAPDLALLLSSAVTAIESQVSISARLRQKIHLLGHELVGSGSYEQIGRQEQRRFRLELKVPVGDGMSSFERIHTGKYLWVCEELGSQTTLAQIDVQRVRQVLARRAGPRVGVASGGGIAMPLEGLPKLLANLNDSFQFTIAREGHLDQLAVWQLEGTWKPAVLAEWAGNQKTKILAGEPIDWKALPQQLPQRVVLTLGHDDLFPYRMEYLRESPSAENGGARRMADTIATLEFFEVRLGGQIPLQRFVFQPGNRTHVDGTDAYLKQLGITDAAPPAGLHSKAPSAAQR